MSRPSCLSWHDISVVNRVLGRLCSSALKLSGQHWAAHWFDSDLNVPVCLGTLFSCFPLPSEVNIGLCKPQLRHKGKWLCSAKWGEKLCRKVECALPRHRWSIIVLWQATICSLVWTRYVSHILTYFTEVLRGWKWHDEMYATQNLLKEGQNIEVTHTFLLHAKWHQQHLKKCIEILC